MPDRADLSYSYDGSFEGLMCCVFAIEGRNNPRCRRALMPKRYWSQMTELQGHVAKRLFTQ